MTDKSRRLYKAVKKWNWAAIDKFVKDGGDINASLVLTGPKAGYTALHFAVLTERKRIVKELVYKYEADVNVVAVDGVQPIHLAILREDLEIAEYLLGSGSGDDNDSLLTKKIFEKYSKDSCYNRKWSDDFGNKMTILTFIIINNNMELIKLLERIYFNAEIKDKNNKTLLMYFSENERFNSYSWNYHSVIHLFIENIIDKPKWMNARDNKGLHAVHYLLPYEELNGFRYDAINWFEENHKLIENFIEAGADINAMVDNDPNSLLINRAAYRCSFWILTGLLNLEVPLSVEARPLKYIMLPVNPEKDIRDMKEIEGSKRECLDLILESLALKRAVGLFVHEEEIKLMDKLVATDCGLYENISIVENFVDDFLKKVEIFYGDKKVLMYDLANEVFNNKRLKLLVKNEQVVEAYKKFYDKREQYGISYTEVLDTMYQRISKAFVSEVKLWRKYKKFET